MAISDYYVSVSGGGAHDGTSEANAWTWAEMAVRYKSGGAGQPGDRINVKTGTYSFSGTETWVIDGTPASPIIVRGYNTTIGDLPARLNGNGLLDTTNYPLLSFGANYSWNGSGADYHIWDSLVVQGSVNTALVQCGSGSVLRRISAANASTGASASALILSGFGTLIECDASHTGASGGLSAISLSGAVAAIGCYVPVSAAAGILASGANVVVNGCVVYGVGGDGIAMTSTTAGRLVWILHNTIDGAGGDGISLSNAASTSTQCIVGNQITNCGGYGINSEYAGTANVAALLANNRIRDCTSGAVNGLTDWAAATSYGHVTGAQADAAEYVNRAAKNFNLKYAALGRGLGSMRYRDIGALQREEVLPAATDLWNGATCGPTNDQLTGTKRASSIANCEAGNVKKDVVIDDVTGTYEGEGGGNVIVIED